MSPVNKSINKFRIYSALVLSNVLSVQSVTSMSLSSQIHLLRCLRQGISPIGLD
ncbi:hypothetical protein Gotur_007892, partial [Gossypium turneri]